jgi:CheY-like chemotaxis protein
MKALSAVSKMGSLHPTSAELAPMPQSRRKVLIVDDEEIMRELLTLHLTHHGYSVILAADAVEAAHLVLKEHPDLIVLDVELPYMDGYEFVAALKADPATKHVPVVFLTSREDVADRATALGASAYLNKPVLATQLLKVLETLL